MKILIMNWRDPLNPKAGGAEAVTLEHAKAWVSNGHDVTWLATRFSYAAESEVIDGVKIVRLGNTFTQFILFPYYYLRHRKAIDIVVDEIHGLPYMTPLYVRKKKIAFIHEVADSVWDAMFQFPLNKLGYLLERLSLTFYKNTPFFTVSPSTKQDLNLLGIKQVSVVLNGVRFPKLKCKKEDSPTFIFISRLVKMKGIEDVLKTFSIIHKKDTDARLWIVGEGDELYIRQLKSQSKKLDIDNAVKFWGRISDEKKFELLGKAHLLLHASIKEGWGLVVLEAASQGTPAVVYNVPGLRDSVKNEVTGLITNDNTPEEMSENALTIIQDKKKYINMQANAINWAKSLTWDEATKKSIELIQAL